MKSSNPHKRRIAIIVMSDEHSGLALSSGGHPWIKTPFMDDFGANNTKFASAYTNSPICIPARASFTTGLYAHESRNWDNALPYNGTPKGWTHALRDHGIDVTSIGKLHYRSETEDTGFTRQILPMHVVNGVGDLLGAVRDPLPVRHKSRSMADEVGIGESNYTRYDRNIAAASIDWIKDHSDQDNWVLFSSFVAPHFPLIAPEQFASLYHLEDIPLPKLSRAADRHDHPWIDSLRKCFIHDQFFDDQRRREALLSYGALCSFMDDHFRQICHTIETCGLADEALVIYTSDHGDNMGSRGLWGKSTLYEEAARIPMLMRAPGSTSPKVVNTHVSLVDVAPTILEWMGLPIPASLPGKSLLSVASQPDDLDRAVFSEYHAAGAETGAYMVRQGKWKLIYYVKMEPELFDLDNDPEELNNLAQDGNHDNIVARLTMELKGIVDPEAQDAIAKADQRALLDEHGGREAVIARGGFGATPAPGAKAQFR
ncbi:sulfatase-like hydrolase/transferase [Advenella kashmirensis]|uniref:sulfatase-like hydrolase/transferase n=1 Tax=Advenella kashmirensis TaxID=310575 RepID=UPI00041F8FDC|nr:sulfatase-like hydrolase/transferase [Advenella kashmirensis]